MIERRALLVGSAALATLAAPSAHSAASRSRAHFAHRLRALEQGDARLGVCLLDTHTGETCGTRMDEHFATCSTFKLALVTAYLREHDAGRINLTEVLPYSRSDLLSWAPITEENVDKGGMTIAALAQAAQEISDGTAANLLIKRLGGPAAVTAKYREMGDAITRLDRYEPGLGMVLSADLRDTTTPLAMANLVKRATTGTLLKPKSRDLLLGWMKNTKTGGQRLRAGLPSDWPTGNKTGTGRAVGTTNKCNDVAITFPPGKPPIIISAYFDSAEYTEQTEDRHQAVLAEVGKIAAEWAMA
jgi:beta-lactamase class A